LATFEELAVLLDEVVGETLSIALRRGDADREIEVEVTDLHAVTPNEFVTIGDAVLHRLSYQQARHLNAPIEGIYVANPGYMLSAAAVPRAAVIVEVDGRPTPDLDAFIAALSGKPDGSRAAVRYFEFDAPRSTRLRSVRIDRRWFPAEYCRRDDASGYWPCERLPEVGAAETPQPASTSFPPERDPRLKTLQRSLVMVNYEMPYTVSGISDRFYHGTGLIVDAARGLVVVDRNTVPEALGDVTLTFAGSLEVPGRVAWIHPLHNLAVVAYDPRLIGDTPVRPATLSTAPVHPGDPVWVVGLKGDHRLASQATQVASIDALSFPLSRTLRFRDSNLETIQLVSGPGDFDGVLSDARGRVLGMWSSFAFEAGQTLEQTNKGVPAALVEEVLALARGERELRSMETEFLQLPLASARRLGLSEELARKLETHDPERRQVLQVLRTVAGTPAARLLQPGDLLLEIDGRTVSRFRAVEAATQAPRVSVTIWREGRAKELEIPTVVLGSGGVDRVVSWAGALLQAPHRAMAAQRGIEPTGVFVSYFSFGSPATRYGLGAGRRIVEVDGRPTPDLDRFLEVVAGRPDRSSLRLRTVNWNGQVEVITLKLDNRYWPPYELVLTEDGWQRRAIPVPSS
jgi:S1-C subfamily serine protease